MKERWKINVNAIYASHDFIAGELVLFPWVFRLFQPRQTHIIQTWRRARIVQLSDLADMLDYFEITIKTCVWDFYNIIIPVLITRSISLTILSLFLSLSLHPFLTVDQKKIHFICVAQLSSNVSNQPNMLLLVLFFTNFMIIIHFIVWMCLDLISGEKKTLLFHGKINEITFISSVIMRLVLPFIRHSRRLPFALLLVNRDVSS